MKWVREGEPFPPVLKEHCYMVVRLMKVALLTVRCSFYFIDKPTYIVLLANEPFSLAWSFAELLEPPVLAIAVYVNCGSLATVN